MKYTTLLIFGASIISSGFSLHCYNCRSGLDETCDSSPRNVSNCKNMWNTYRNSNINQANQTLISRTLGTTINAEEKWYCVKIKCLDSGYVERGCIPESGAAACALFNNKPFPGCGGIGECTTCTADLCNSSSYIYSTTLLIILISMFLQALS